MVPGSYDEECKFQDLPVVDEDFYLVGGDDVWLHSHDDAVELANYLNAKRFLYQAIPAMPRSGNNSAVHSRWCVRYVRSLSEEYNCVVALCMIIDSPELISAYYGVWNDLSNSWHVFKPEDGSPFWPGGNQSVPLFEAAVNSYEAYACKLFTRVRYSNVPAYSTSNPSYFKGKRKSDIGFKTWGFEGLLANGVCKLPGKGKTIRKSRP